MGNIFSCVGKKRVAARSQSTHDIYLKKTPKNEPSTAQPVENVGSSNTKDRPTSDQSDITNDDGPTQPDNMSDGQRMNIDITSDDPTKSIHSDETYILKSASPIENEVEIEYIQSRSPSLADRSLSDFLGSESDVSLISACSNKTYVISSQSQSTAVAVLAETATSVAEDATESSCAVTEEHTVLQSLKKKQVDDSEENTTEIENLVREEDNAESEVDKLDVSDKNNTEVDNIVREVYNLDTPDEDTAEVYELLPNEEGTTEADKLVREEVITESEVDKLIREEQERMEFEQLQEQERQMKEAQMKRNFNPSLDVITEVDAARIEDDVQQTVSACSAYEDSTNVDLPLTRCLQQDTNVDETLTRSCGSGMKQPLTSLCHSPAHSLVAEVDTARSTDEVADNGIFTKKTADTITSSEKAADTTTSLEKVTDTALSTVEEISAQLCEVKDIKFGEKLAELNRTIDELDSMIIEDESLVNVPRSPHKSNSNGIISPSMQSHFKNVLGKSNDSFKAGLLLHSTKDASSPVSRQASKISVNKISPLVSTEDMHDKTLVKSNKGYGIQKQSSATWRIVPFDIDGNFSDIMEDVEQMYQDKKKEDKAARKKKRRQEKREKAAQQPQPPQQEALIQQPTPQNASPKKEIVLDENSTMDTIEEFLRNREHIDRTEFDLVVRNLVETETKQEPKYEETFPTSRNNIPLNSHSKDVITRLDHLNFNNRLNMDTTPRNLAASRFPVIGEKRYNPQHQFKGKFVNNPNPNSPSAFENGQNNRLPNASKHQLSPHAFSRHLLADAIHGSSTTVPSERRINDMHQGSLPTILDSEARMQDYDLNDLSDPEETLNADALISCFHGNENTNLPTVDYNSNHLPPINLEGKALVSMGTTETYPMDVIQREISELDLFKGSKHQQLAEKTISVCKHERVRSMCTLCVRPPSRGGRALMTWLNTKKMNRLKNQRPPDTLQEQMENF